MKRNIICILVLGVLLLVGCNSNSNKESNNISKKTKKSYPLKTDPNYISYNTQGSNQNNHFSTQGTTGETKYIQTEKNISPKLIHKEKPKQKSKKTIENRIYDCNCTLNLNLKIIQDVLKSTQLSKLKGQQIKSLQNKFEIISKFINERQLLKKEKEKELTKKLLNAQIILETKKRKEETLNSHKEVYQEYIEYSKKKDITIRKCHKKFNEIQIYIRRESQNFPKYKRIYGNYSIDNFILENENMLRLKEKLNNFILQKNVAMSLLIKEINIMKNNNCIIDNINVINNINEYKKYNPQKKIDVFILIGEDKLKNNENKKVQIEQIFNKINYVFNGKNKL